MIAVEKTGIQSYHPDMSGDLLHVEKGYCHFSQEGAKDFLDYIAAYEPQSDGIVFDVATFRGQEARVKISFISETAFRLQMFPYKKEPEKRNEVFSGKTIHHVQVNEEPLFIVAKTDRLTLTFRKCPWEMSVNLDGQPLTKEQIKDHNVDQKYKAIPIGFTTDENGKVINAFETMYMYCDEDFYGFGEKFTSFRKRGQKITVWQRDAQSTNSDISYKGMPYFMSSTGYSVLLNTYTRSHFNMGATSGVSYTMETEDPYLDYYMFCNRDYKGLVQDYTAFSGRSAMIPKWGFGFWMSRMSYESRVEVEEIVGQMERFGMSVDVIHIDHWMTYLSEESEKDLLCFDEERFPNPEEMIQSLKKKGIHLSLWMFPYVPYRMKDGTCYGIYDAMKERGFLVKNPDGEPYTFFLGEGDVGGNRVAALDFTNPELVAYMKKRIKRLMYMGVGVIKTDFSEEIPEDAVFYDGTAGLQSHNKYTLLYAKTIYEASAEAKQEMGERAMIWCRSGFAGSQNYPASWAGDSSAAQNNLFAILNGGLSMGLSGVSFWGFDIGGFYNCDYSGKRVIPENEEYIRSVQMGLMSPLSRSHGQSTPREPWVYSDVAQKAFLKINKFRYRLMPYLYSTAYETHLEGLPMMRAMLLEFPEDLSARSVSSQYMLGGSILVAPVFDQQKQHVYLPAGSWVDLETGRRVEGGSWIACERDIYVIPMFLRDNSVIQRLQKAPDHIGDCAFNNLEIVMNLTGCLNQKYYDDGVEGQICAKLTGKQVEITVKQIPVKNFRIYSNVAICKATVNGEVWNVMPESDAVILEKA